VEQGKTIIIGGGIAGLYAAKLLEEQQKPFVLLEAKAAFGGRIYSQSSFDKPGCRYDLGPTWFWSHQTKIKALLAELDIDWFEQYSSGDVIYQMGASSQPSRTSGAGVMTSYRVNGGMGAMIDKLQSKISPEKLKANHQVYKVTRNQNTWQVYANTENSTHVMFEGKELLVALPPRILNRYLTPENWLSQDAIRALQAEPTWMSAQAKFVAVYQKAFWREQGLSGQAYSRVGPLVEINDASAYRHCGFALFGFIGLPAQHRAAITDKEMKYACLSQLAQLFGSEAMDAKETYITDWAKDQYVATAQDVSESPRHAAFPLTQFKGELDAINVNFIGSEFDPLEAGYLEGALSVVTNALVVD